MGARGVTGTGVPRLGEHTVSLDQVNGAKNSHCSAAPAGSPGVCSTPHCCGNGCASVGIFMLCKRSWGNLNTVPIPLLGKSPFGGSRDPGSSEKTDLMLSYFPKDHEKC